MSPLQQRLSEFLSFFPATVNRQGVHFLRYPEIAVYADHPDFSPMFGGRMILYAAYEKLQDFIRDFGLGSVADLDRVTPEALLRLFRAGSICLYHVSGESTTALAFRYIGDDLHYRRPGKNKHWKKLGFEQSDPVHLSAVTDLLEIYGRSNGN